MIKKADYTDIRNVSELALVLWPKHLLEELEEDMSNYILGEDSAVFIKYYEDIPVGFAQCTLRRDYVEGCESSPIGYLEGIFVREDYRKKDIGRQLVQSCEEWSKLKGCIDFASDCEINNIGSFYFHKKVGFTEANRIICFHKKI